MSETPQNALTSYGDLAGKLVDKSGRPLLSALDIAKQNSGLIGGHGTGLLERFPLNNPPQPNQHGLDSVLDESELGASAGHKFVASPDCNAIADAATLGKLAVDLFKIGQPDAANALLKKAQLIGDHAVVGINWPGFEPMMGKPFDLREPLVKSMAMEKVKPSGTVHRFSEVLLRSGAYEGIKDPAQATNVTMSYLMRVAREPLVEPFISLNASKAQRFGKQPAFRGDTGFQVRMREKDGEVTPAARKRIEDLTNLFLHGGFKRNEDGSLRRHPETGEPGVWDGNGESKAQPFAQYLSTISRYSWTLDWACTRMEPGADQDAYPISFFTPAASEFCRLTYPEFYKAKFPENEGKAIKYIELPPDMGVSTNAWGIPQGAGGGGVYPGEVVCEYTWDRMWSLVRRPRMDILSRGYSTCELEIALEVILALTLGFDFQKDYFDKNHVPLGILAMTGFASPAAQQTMQMLRAQISHSSGGGKNFWRVIAMALNPGATLNFVPLRSQSGGIPEMSFVKEYTVMNVNILAAIMQCNAEEVGWQAVSSKGGGIGGDADPETKLQHSEDKGFKPGMDAIFAGLNDNMVDLYDPDFEIVAVGLDGKSEMQELQVAQQKMGIGFSFNSVMDSMDEDRLRAPVLPPLYVEVSQKFNADQFTTNAEHRAAVEKEYEKQFRKLVPDETIMPYSAWTDLPVGSAMGAMQIVSQEQQALIQALQAGAQQKAMQGAMQNNVPQDIASLAHQAGLDPAKLTPEQTQYLQQQAQQAQMAQGGAPPGQPEPGQPDAGQPGAQQAADGSMQDGGQDADPNAMGGVGDAGDGPAPSDLAQAQGARQGAQQGAPFDPSDPFGHGAREQQQEQEAQSQQAQEAAAQQAFEQSQLAAQNRQGAQQGEQQPEDDEDPKRPLRKSFGSRSLSSRSLNPLSRVIEVIIKR